MKKTVLALMLSFACGLVAYAQKSETKAAGQANSQTTATVHSAGKNLELASGTQLTGELQTTLDVRRAKVGDQVILKTTQAIKSGGRTVLSKGSRLLGHVSEVARTTKSSGESRLGILFDQLENGSLRAPLAASISSVTSGRANTRVSNDGSFAGDVSAGGSARSMASAQGSSGGSNGGLLGGVGGVANSTTSTVGGVVGGTTSAIGTTVDSTTGALGSTATGVGRSLNGIQISQSSNASVEGGSVLSLQGGNLRLDKGTYFSLVLTQSTSAGPTKDQ